ncbi:MAG: PAS domain S-box protein [Luteolibacter sp.]
MAVLFALFLSGTAWGEAASPPQSIRVVIDNNYPPYVFLDPAGQLQGIIVDQWRLWEKKSGIAVDLRGMDWDEAQQRMRAREFDVIDTVFKTKEREGYYDFSPPYAQLNVPIFFHRDISGITDLESLRGFPVAAKAGDAVVDLLRAKGVTTLQLFPNYEAIVTAAKEHKVSVFVVDEPPALYYLYKLGIADDFRMTEPVNVGQFHRAVQKGNAQRLQQVEAGFARISPEELRQIEDKWMGQSLHPRPYLRPLIITAIGTVIVLALLAGWNWTLGRRVRQRTQELHASQALLKDVVDNSPSIIFIKDLAGNYLLTNKLFLKVLDSPHPSLVGLTDFDIFPREVAEAYRSDDREVAESGVVRQLEEVAPHSDGDHHYFTVKFPLKDKKGSVVAVAGIATDITERKQAAEALRASEKQFHASFEQAAVGMAQIGLDGRWLQVNQRACEILGYSREELYQKTFQEITHPEDLDADLTLVRQVLDGELQTYTLEKRYLRQDQSVIPADLTVSLVRKPDGTPDYFVSVIVDITERKRAEQHIKQLNRTYAVLSEINQLIVRESESQKLLQEVCQIAVTKGEFKMAWIGLLGEGGKDIDIRAHHGASADTLEKLDALIHSETSGANCDFTRQSLTTGEHAVCNNIQNDPCATCSREAALSRDYHSMVALPLKVGGKVVGAFNLYSSEPEFFDDIEMRLLDELATDIGFALDIRQREREHAQLEEQFRQSQKMDAIGQLAGGVAHDFNNILGVILMQAELSGMTPGLPEEIQDGFKQIRTSAERAANLTRQLLLFGRKQMIQAHDLDLNMQVKNVTKMLQRIIGEDVELQLQLCPVPLITRADAGMMDQVLLNLAVNSRDAMPGGGRLSIATAELTVDAENASLHSDAAPGRYVMMSVGDTGCGISPKDMPHIFEPFFTTKEAGKGTGLGLASVYGIVKQHHGWIKVDSEQGEGTNFQIYLPASAAPTDQSRQDETFSQLQAGTETILLVEDEEAVRKLTRMALQMAGYKVLEAPDGVVGLKVWEEHQEEIQLLLTDMVMPEGVSGRELAASLQARNPKLRVIFTSGYSADMVNQGKDLLEGRNFVPKPASIQQLLDTVRQSLDRERE